MVVPGKPASIEVATQGSASALGFGTTEVEVTVRDQFGNLVADKTSVELTISGDALLEEYDPGTTGGKVRAKIKGDEFATESNTLMIKSGDVEKNTEFAIYPLNVAFTNAPAVVKTNKTETVSVMVTDHEGQPASGVPITLFSTRGLLKENIVVTGGDGSASATFHTGFDKGEGTFIAAAGFAGIASRDYTVEDETDDRTLDTSRAMIVGDAVNNGYAEYERYDGMILGLAYKTSTDITITGTPGETVTVGLGDMADPNTEPLASLCMNDLAADANGYEAPDELGLHNARAENISVVNDGPFGVGRAYEFDKGTGSVLKIPGTGALNPVQNIGFRTDFKPSQNGGDLFDHENGTQRLRYTSDGKVVYSIRTDAGTYQAESPGVLELNKWHTVAGRYCNGQLELEINGVPAAPVQAGGNLLYEGSSSGIRVGLGYSGRMDGFRWYDWSAQPLVKFPNMQEKTDVIIGSDGKAVVTLKGTGQMGQHQAQASLRTLRIAVRAKSARKYVSLISKAAYAEIAGGFVDNETLFPNAPPIDLTYAPYRPGITDFFVRPAHAGILDWLNPWELLLEAVSWIIPYEDFMMLGRQIYYLTTKDWQNFNAVDLVFSALNVATVIPMAKPLKPFLKPLKRFIKPISNKPIVKSVAGVLGKAADLAMHGKTQRLLDILPYFMVVGEMIVDTEARQGFFIMVDSIGSADDLWAWFDYMRLPVGGWDGDEIPKVNIAVAYASPGHRKDTFYAGASGAFKALYESVVPSAYAGPTDAVSAARRILGSTIGKVIKQVAEAGGGHYLENPQHLSGLFRSTFEVIKDVADPDIRKFIHRKKFLKAGLTVKKKGIKALKEFIKGRDSDRVSRRLLIGCIAYLEESMINGKITSDLDKPKEIRELYLDALVIAKNQMPKAHGKMFQIVQIAYYQFIHEFAGGPPVREVEGERPVIFYASPQDRNNDKEYFSYNRTVDVILGTNEGSLVIRVTVIFIIKQHVMIFSVFSDNLHNCSNPLPS